MTFELEVPFVEKEQAKNLGARWNAVRKKWYVPAGLDINNFRRWWPSDAVSYGVAGKVFGDAAENAASNTNNNVLNYLAAYDPGSTELTGQTEQPEAAQGDNAAQQILLSQFLQNVSNVIHQALPGKTWIAAEISELRKYSGYYFLNLVEYQNEIKIAQAKAMIWQAQERQTVTKFKQATEADLEPGIKVLILVSVNFHIQHGLALIIHDIDPSYTLGNMAAKLAKIRETLQAEKIIANNKLLPNPLEFTKVAVISPEQAAGLGDFQREAALLAKYNLCEFCYFSATFQGKSAPESILQALHNALNQHVEQQFDALVIIRGGGAVADLAWLNDLALARAICLAPLKVLVGIGHERDYTIIDEVAGLKFDTPSKTIHHILSTITTNANQAEHNFREIVNCSKNVLIQTASKIKIMQDSISATIFKQLALKEQMINNFIQNIKQAAPQLLNLALLNTEQVIKEILALGPTAILQRGFALVKDLADNAVISRAMAIQQAELRVQFHDGEVQVKPLINH